MEGATPESTHDTVNATPPGKTAPAAGAVIFTSADASGHEATRTRSALSKRMMGRVAETGVGCRKMRGSEGLALYICTEEESSHGNSDYST
jgi:hypothetical protein